MGRFIAIGDVHGCWSELEQLIDKLGITPADEILFLGDLVNRGPDSVRVVRSARRLRAKSLLGNHEYRLLSYRLIQDPSILREGDRVTLESLESEDWDYLGKMKLTHYLPREDVLFVHGGFLPGIPWYKQSAAIVTRIQVIDEDGQPRKRSESPHSKPWADYWEGPPFVVYGHTPMRNPYRAKAALGIDTGCVQGGTLSAWILPDRTLVQVDAHRAYVPTQLSD